MGKKKKKVNSLPKDSPNDSINDIPDESINDSFSNSIKPVISPKIKKDESHPTPIPTPTPPPPASSWVPAVGAVPTRLPTFQEIQLLQMQQEAELKKQKEKEQLLREQMCLMRTSKDVSMNRGILASSNAWGNPPKVITSLQRPFSAIQAEQMKMPVPRKKKETSLVFKDAASSMSVFSEDHTTTAHNTNPWSAAVSSKTRSWGVKARPRSSVRSLLDIQKEESIKKNMVIDDADDWDEAMLNSSFAASCVQTEESKQLQQLPIKHTMVVSASNGDQFNHEGEWNIVQKKGRKVSQNRRETSTAASWNVDSNP